MIRRINRRRFLAGMSTTLLGGCDDLSNRPWLHKILASAETLNHTVHRRVLPHQALAPEYTEADISPNFRANGSTNPDTALYRRLVATGFADWRLTISGLVDHPARFSLAELRAMPSRTQITRHDCVEGWSCIGKWKGVPLTTVLTQVGVQPTARFVVFICADAMEDGALYYESIGLDDAHHPQTILAYDMNNAALPVAHGAPLRLRVERQLGYKMAKYVMDIQLVDSFAQMGGGGGGYWEDRGYEWYAGI